ncbi:hypothetical protein ATERTT37_002080 [Aspergillus terreus]
MSKRKSSLVKEAPSAFRGEDTAKVKRRERSNWRVRDFCDCGFEQANKYVIMDANGNHIGYMAEQERVTQNTYSATNGLQAASTGSLVQATGDSHTRVSSLGLGDMRVIGEAQQQWAPLRRKYNLFTYHHSPNAATDMGAQKLPLAQSGLSSAQQMQLTQAQGSGQGVGEYNQFAYVDEPFLSWDFSLRSADSQLIGSVNRNFAGFAREFFTDTGVYALRMDSAALSPDQAPTQTSTVTVAPGDSDSCLFGFPVLGARQLRVARLLVAQLPEKLEQ